MGEQEDSKQVIVAKGGDISSVIGTGWSVLDSTEILGWPVHSDGSFALLWGKLQKIVGGILGKLPSSKLESFGTSTQIGTVGSLCGTYCSLLSWSCSSWQILS